MGIDSGPPVGFFPGRLLSEKEKDMPKSNHDKLVEEIADKIRVDKRNRYHMAWVEDIITRITQAMADGELNEILGVVGQAETGDGWDEGIHHWLGNMIEAEATRFIAFRSKEKEEGKDA